MRVIYSKNVVNTKTNETPEETMYDDDVSSESDGLEIDISSPKPNTDEIDIESKLVLENLEEEIERQLDEKASKSKLTATNVKNILKHVITNEHVLAMVRNTAEDNNAEMELIYEPKFTRAKAKELLKSHPSSIPSWAKSKNESEVHILINEELPEESDDEEYVPVDEEPSEDEKEGNQHSDVDSQPATPKTPASTSHDNSLPHDSSIVSDVSTQTNWADDEIFKIPLPKSPTPTDLIGDNENIALRTRSKLSLSDTPLEIIEEAFIPPDITTDMYDLECDDDDWSDFLKKFTRPLDEAVHGTQEDDDETDPEYNVLADEENDKIDKEELRQDKGVKITKKELNTLVAELFEFSELFANEAEFEALQNTNINPEPQLEATTTEEQLQTCIPNPVINEEIPIKIEAVLPLFSEERKLLLEQQLRQHIQLATQQYILSYQHPEPEVSDMSETFKTMVMSIHEKAEEAPDSILNVCNLKPAVSFVEDWETMMASDDPAVKEMKQHISNDYFKRKNDVNNKSNYEYVVNHAKLLQEKVSTSDVFIYPSLLPPLPFRYFPSKVRNNYIPSEDQLIAMGLEQFMPYMENDKSYYTKFGTLRILDVAYFISKYMTPAKTSKQICSHIKEANSCRTFDNAIKYYFQHKTVPKTMHLVSPLNVFGVVPPCKRPADMLPNQWKQFVAKEPKLKIWQPQVVLHQITPQRKVLIPSVIIPPKKVLIPPAYNKRPAIKKVTRTRKRKPTGNIKPVACGKDIYFLNADGNLEKKIEVSPTQLVIIDKKTPLTIIPKSNSNQLPKEQKKERKILPKFQEIYIPECSNTSLENEDNVNCRNISNDDLLKFKFNSSIFNQSKNKDMLPSMPFLMTPVKQPERDKSPDRDPLDKSVEILQKSIEDVSKEVQEKSTEDISIEVQQKSTEDNEIVLVDLQQKTSEDSEVKCQKDSKKDDEDELNALMIASSTIQQKNRRLQANTSKKAKQLREHNATLAMLCPEDPNTSEEKAKNYAQAFYDKVQERLEIESPDQYQQFMEALSEHDESSSTVSELYEKIDSVLSPQHSDLSEEFLTFLTPEQAKQIGKLVPHFLLSNMSLFLRKLEIYYSSQPAQIRRIYNSLTELAEIADVTMEKIRSTILPLLKGNALLIDWFLQMFPEEAPPESLMSDWEQINGDDGDMNAEEKAFETIVVPEVEDPYGGPNCICKCHDIDNEMYANRSRHCIPCGTKFLQGRVYVQTGKGLRLANVTFNNSPNTDHNKRLSVKPVVRPKRKSENSPTKIMSPTKHDDEPRHSNESEDDFNSDSAVTKRQKPQLKQFRTSSPKARKRLAGSRSRPKPKETKKIKLDPKKPKTTNKIVKIPDKNDENEEILTIDQKQDESVSPTIKKDQEQPKLIEMKPLDTKSILSVLSKNETIESGSKTEPEQSDWSDLKATTTESEPETTDWEPKASPGHSVESIDTCEESSQDTIDGPGSSDNDSTVEEIESVISDQSEDSDDVVTENENSRTWTRDEDKVILKTFQERGDSQNVFKDIQHLLPDRTVLEIKQRFHTLLSLLKEMASSSQD